MSATPKHPLPIVLPVANRIVDALRPHCARIELAGSIRRERPTVGDIEIVAVPTRPVDLLGDPLSGPTPLDNFLAQRVTFSKRGERYQQFQYGRHKIDLFLTDADTWGSIYTIRTGSWEFSRWLVTSQSARGAAPQTSSSATAASTNPAASCPRPKNPTSSPPSAWPTSTPWSVTAPSPPRPASNPSGITPKTKSNKEN